MKLRPYQKKCLEIIKTKKPGSYLIQMATGLGKTVVFSQLEDIFPGRILIISHREELVYQPGKYFKSSFGIEQGKCISNGERIISATNKSLFKRLDKFSKDDFEIIITDECHHSPSKTYRAIYDYFNFKYHFGFSATPNRGDQIRLDDIFEEIIFERPLKWGILNKYLCGIECKAINIGYDLKNVKSADGDYQQKSLIQAVNIDSANEAIAEIYHKYSKGQTLIFCTSIDHCHKLNDYILEAKVIDSKSDINRKQLIQDFKDQKFKCLINCLIFTEGTDVSCIQTIIIARPTKNASLYTQMVGRGLRLDKSKEKLLLIDCVGSHINDLCISPILFGLNVHDTNLNINEIKGDLFDLSNLIMEKINDPRTWIKNIRNIQLFKKKFGYDLHNVNYFLNADGSFILSFPNFYKKIPSPDKLGYIDTLNGKMKLQEVFDIMYNYLIKNRYNQIQLWDLKKIKQWGKYKASDKQKELIKKHYPDFEINSLNKMEAMILINKIGGKNE